MRPMIYVLLPLSALAATAIPTDPARACDATPPRATVTATSKAEPKPALVETKKEVRKLEAL